MLIADMQQNDGIATLTLNPAIDVNTSVDAVVSERKLRCEAPTHEPGGGGINVARAIRNLGGTSTALVVAGGRTGDRLIETLERESIGVKRVDAAGETRQNINVYERVSTLQYRFLMPGPPFDDATCTRVTDAVEGLSEDVRWIVASGSLPAGVPDDFYRRLAAGTHQARLIIDTSGKALRASLGSGVFLIKPNVDEFRTLIGDEQADDAALERGARAIIAEGGSEVIVVSLGSAGVLLATRERTLRIAAPTVRIASKVGAGDSTVAGIVLALARGAAVEDAVRFGVAAGAAAVMTPGTELCRREDTERLYAAMSR